MSHYRLCLLVLLAQPTVYAGSSELDSALGVLRTASPTAAAGDDLRAAWKTVAAADADKIPVILRSMTDSNPAAENWMRAAADAIAERATSANTPLPEEALASLLRDTSASPRGRRVAYELLRDINPEAAREMLAGMTDDPSLEIRYDAIALGLEAVGENQDKELTLETLQALFRSARDLEQTKEIKARLEELGESIDLATHLGFITSWRVISSFDNTNKSGFDVAYPPESQIDFAATYEGKVGPVAWRDAAITTEDELGEVDLNEAIGAEKGAIAYAYAEIEAQSARPAEIRYASGNATKLWLNGELVAANEVYHAGGEVDQYTSPVELRAGKNTVLLKVCQNEQTEPWAQDWGFQLRVTDELGGSIDMRSHKD